MSDLVRYARGSVQRALPSGTETSQAQAPAPADYKVESPLKPPPSDLDTNAKQPPNGEAGADNRSALTHAPDLKLPPTMNALVLVSQCTIQLSMNDVDAQDGSIARSTGQEKVFNDRFKEDSLIEDIVGKSRLTFGNLSVVLASPHRAGQTLILTST